MSLEKYILAGKILAKARDETAKQIVEGNDFISIIKFCENKIKELGGEIAWVQLSPTTTAAHFSPTSVDNPVCQKGDLLKLDVGVHIDGYITDTAITVLIESDDKKDNELKQNLMLASKNALESASKLIRAGTKLKDIGKAQFEEAEKLGFTTIKNLCGHTLERWKVHGGISIPSYENNDELVLEDGMVVAIEPFVTNGKGFIHEKGVANVFMIDSLKNTRSMQGRKVLQFVKDRNSLPFDVKDLEEELGRATAVIGVRDLYKNHIVNAYPPLVEVSNCPVAQFEHTFIVGYGCITKNEE